MPVNPFMFAMANPMQMQMAQMQQMQQVQMAVMMQMQMGAMAQMQMGAMQMAAMMPMMQMAMPMAAMVPMMQMPQCGKEEEADEEQISVSSPEDVTALEVEIKEAEKAAKAAAKDDGAYVGLMARYIDDEGFGFISCPDCKDAWDKTDIFVSGRNFVASGIEVGDVVVFQVEKDGKDLPRAVNPKTLKELTRLKRRLSKMRELVKAALLKRSFFGGLPPATGEPGPEAKRAHLG